MTYKMHWEIPQRVIVITYTDEITIEDLQGVNRDLAACLEEGIAPVHVISYLQTNVFPTNFRLIKDLVTTLRQDGWGWFIVAGFENALGRFLMTVVTNTFRLQAKAVDTLDEAILTLARADTTLMRDSA